MTERARPRLALRAGPPPAGPLSEAAERERFRDALLGLLAQAHRTPAELVLPKVCEAVAEFFVEAPCAVLHLRRARAHPGPDAAAGAEVATIGAPAMALDDEALRVRCQALTLPSSTSGRLRAWSVGLPGPEHPWSLALLRPWPASPDDDELLVLQLPQAPDDLRRQRRAWFSSWAQGQTELLLMLHIAHRLHAAR